MTESKFIKSLKKVELHRHFEGCITPHIFHELMKNHPESDYAIFENVERLYQFQDFLGFLDAFITVVSFISSYQDFQFLAELIARDLVEENIVYTEFLFSPEPFMEMGLDMEKIFEVMMDAFEGAGCRTGMVVDLVRHLSRDSTFGCLEALIDVRNRNPRVREWVKGISIGGNETLGPAVDFVEHFDLARQNGLKLSAHAGEGDGPGSVRDAILKLKVDRIGHGVRSVEDEELLDLLQTSSIMLDVSISSNYFTGVSEKGNHQIKQLIEHNIPVSINTDDPGFFKTDLNKEYQLFLDYGYSQERLAQVIIDSVNHSFLPEKEKIELIEELQAN